MLKDKRKYSVNDSYFKKWSNDMAYVLGFWWTDGCIYKKNNLFSITQNKSDSGLLINILGVMNSNYPLKFYRNYCRFDIRSKSIVDDIVLIGGKERKSLDIGFPYVPDKYLPDFIRGLWDGDGYVGNTKRQLSYVSEFSCGSKSFINDMLDILRKSISDFGGGIKIDIRKKGTKNSSGKIRSANHICYGLRLNQNDTRRLRNFIYSTSSKLRMDRKYNKFILAGEICIATKLREYLTFQDAKKYVANLNIGSQKEWRLYSKSKNKPLNIPSNPYGVYKGKGWTNWNDFFGKVKIKNEPEIIVARPKINTWEKGFFWSYDDAKKYVHDLHFSSVKEWEKYRKIKLMPAYIPSTPPRTYKNKGWINWKDWLGYDKEKTKTSQWQKG